MIEKNLCINCGNEILEADKRICEECSKKPEKKHLSNIDIITKYHFSKNKIRQISNKLGGIIDSELNKLSSLKERYLINEENMGLLDDRMGKLILFRDKIIEGWKDTIKDN